MSFEKRLKRAFAEWLEPQHQQVRSTRDDHVVEIIQDIVLNAMRDCRPEKEEPFQHAYQHVSVGYCLVCGWYNHPGKHICKPGVPLPICLKCGFTVRDHVLLATGVTCPSDSISGLTDVMWGRPTFPSITISGERFDTLLRWESWGKNIARPALYFLRDNLVAANTLGAIPKDPPEKIS